MTIVVETKEETSSILVSTKETMGAEFKPPCLFPTDSNDSTHEITGSYPTKGTSIRDLDKIAII